MGIEPDTLCKKDPAVAAIVRAWRRLTTRRGERRAGPGERTLVACSGGADSCALALALVLGGRPGSIVIGHVIHDLRSQKESLADRDAAADLARCLGVEFVEGEVRVRGRGGGNLEAAARAARYDMLAAMAQARGIRFVATGHHAEDQIETMMMMMMRGAGSGGGMAAKRRLAGRGAGSIWLIRPMVCQGRVIAREDCRRICTAAGVEWREDATNADTTRLRAAVRHRLTPVLKGIRPDVLARAIAAVAHGREMGLLLRREALKALRAARPVGAGGVEWERSELRDQPGIVIGETLRLARRRICGRTGEDRAGRRAVDPIVRAIRDRSTDPRVFALGGGRVRVSARRVSVEWTCPT